MLKYIYDAIYASNFFLIHPINGGGQWSSSAEVRLPRAAKLCHSQTNRQFLTAAYCRCRECWMQTPVGGRPIEWHCQMAALSRLEEWIIVECAQWSGMNWLFSNHIILYPNPKAIRYLNWAMVHSRTFCVFVNQPTFSIIVKWTWLDPMMMVTKIRLNIYDFAFKILIKSRIINHIILELRKLVWYLFGTSCAPMRLAERPKTAPALACCAGSKRLFQVRFAH